jgi:hypothetical protein
VIHHSDQRSQYTSLDRLEALAVLDDHELDVRFRPGPATDRQTGGGCYRRSGQRRDKSVISHFNSFPS